MSSRGTIYWDESSRGRNGSNANTDKRRGRWVGERLENGRRVRFRSTDYDKVLAWIQHKEIDNPDIRQLVGMKYKVNIRTGDVIGLGGKILTPHSKGGITYTLFKSGKHYSVTHNRIMYAAIISGKASTLSITGYIRSISRQIISNRNKTIKYDSTNNESGRGVQRVRP